jgi:hypothetical protein
MATTSDTPITCTLDIGDYKERLASIAALARDALRSYERDDLVLRLKYTAAKAARVKEMVRHERECCTLLTFDVREEGNEILVTISAPEAARVAAETMFERFVAPASSGAAGSARVALVCACAAAACAAACFAPLVLPAVLLAGTGSILAWLAGAHLWMTVLAILAVVAAWLWIWREAQRLGMRPSSSTLRFMGIASFLLALALVYPLIEPQIVRALGH